MASNWLFLQDTDNFSVGGSSLDSDFFEKPSGGRRDYKIFLRPAYEDGQAIRQNPLYNDESAL